MYQKNICFKLLILFLITSTTAMSQVKNYAGHIVDIFDNPMYGVSITNERTQETVVSNCKGKFTIRSNKGDYLTFIKENYLLHRQQIKSSKKIAILLNFDTQLIQSKIYNEYVSLHDYEVPLEDVFCQILYIVNGSPFNPTYGSGRFLNLDPEDILKVNVLKGKIAAEMFGNAGRNGVIFIQTKCIHLQKQKYPGVYVE